MKHKIAISAITLFLMLVLTAWHSSAYTDCVGIETGDVAGLQYKLTNKDTGVVLDEHNQTVRFTISNDTLIQGFYEGVLGMKKGEQKTFEIPPSKGYTDPNSAPPGFYNVTLTANVLLETIESAIHDCDHETSSPVQLSGSSLLPFQFFAPFFMIISIIYVIHRKYI